MADIWSKEKRSEVMSRVRSQGNKDTELRLIEIFRQARITGWRRKQQMPGKPDFVFRRERVAVFVDGCFWNGCPQCYRRPKSSRKYWDAKIQGNKARDRRISAKLRREGWSVIRVWEHDLKKPQKVVARIKRKLMAKSGQSPESIAPPALDDAAKTLPASLPGKP